MSSGGPKKFEDNPIANAACELIEFGYKDE